MKGIKAVYDFGGVGDRYTVYYSNRKAWGYEAWNRNDSGKLIYPCVGMSDSPFHPQGICQHGGGVLGKHNGKRIKFEELPEDCQRVVKDDFASDHNRRKRGGV